MESQYYRTFVALPLKVEQSFLEARKDLLSSLEGERISWTLPDNFHVTLRFLGDVDRNAVRGIGLALRNGISVPKQTSMLMKGLGSFGPRKRPRVLWVGFEDKGFFDPLKQEVDRVLELCGIPAEEKPFRAHLTLGRVRSLQDPERYYGTVKESSERFRASVSFDRLVFFRSILGSRGPEYQVLEELPFPA